MAKINSLFQIRLFDTVDTSQLQTNAREHKHHWQLEIQFREVNMHTTNFGMELLEA